MTSTIRNRTFDELQPGEHIAVTRVPGRQELRWFAQLAWQAEGDSAQNVTQGSLAATLWLQVWLTQMLATRLPGPGVQLRKHDIRCLAPLPAGKVVTLSIEVVSKNAATSEVELACRWTDTDQQQLVEGTVIATVAHDRIEQTRSKLPDIRTGPASNRTMQRLLDHVAKLEPVRVAVVHPCDATSLSAALDAREAGLIRPVLVAPRSRLEAVAIENGLDLSGAEIVDVPHSHAAASRSAELACAGEVEFLMKGSLHTDELMGAVLAEAGLRTKRRISHCFVLQTPHYPRPFIVTDAAINLAPNLNQKADIIRNAIELAHVIGVERPKVAILAAVETVSPTMPATLDAAALCKMADRGQISGGVLDGPLAFDNAVSMAAARAKGIESEVAGQADILVVPDLESGNMLAKQLMYLGEASSAGIVLGAKVPMVLTSRADPEEARIASCAIALMLAHHYRITPP